MQNIEPGIEEPEDENVVAFETACVEKFKGWRACGNSAEDNGAPPTREALCWKTEDGEYGVRALNAAWWGWQAGRAFSADNGSLF